PSSSRRPCMRVDVSWRPSTSLIVMFATPFSRASWFTTTLRPSTSLASTSSVTESAVWRARMLPRVSVCCATVCCSCSFSASQKATRIRISSRLTLSVILCFIAMREFRSKAWRVIVSGGMTAGASILRRRERDLLDVHELVIHCVAWPLQAVALHVVGAGLPEHRQHVHIFHLWRDDKQAPLVQFANLVAHAFALLRAV